MIRESGAAAVARRPARARELRSERTTPPRESLADGEPARRGASQPGEAHERAGGIAVPDRHVERSAEVEYQLLGRSHGGPHGIRLTAPDNASVPNASERTPLTSGRPRLFLLSFLMLFVELALIRWLGSNVIYLSYFSNFVLLGSFLGIGIGFLRARSPRDTSTLAPIVLGILIALVLIFPIQVQHGGGQLLYFGRGTSGPPVWIALPIVFLIVAAVMSFLGEGVARSFVTFEPLEAYRLDILGSIAGVLVFSALSFLGSPPVGWGLVVGAVFVLLALPERPWPLL